MAEFELLSSIKRNRFIRQAFKDPDGLGSFSYQWLSDNTSIKDATTSTFTLTRDDVGKRISLKVSWSDGQGTEESLTSRATYPV